MSEQGLFKCHLQTFPGPRKNMHSASWGVHLHHLAAPVGWSSGMTPAAPGVSRHPSQAGQGAACKGGAAQQSGCPSSKIHGAKPHLFVCVGILCVGVGIWNCSWALHTHPCLWSPLVTLPGKSPAAKQKTLTRDMTGDW